MNWQNEIAVVTGACGFIGSRLAETLVRLGAETKALAFYDARGGGGWLDDIPRDIRDNMEIVAGDIRDAEQMRSFISGGCIVFHLAALIGIPYSYIAPRSYLETNTTGTLNILLAARDNDAKRVLVTSTSEVYGSAITTPIKETHPLQAQSPYSASKIAAEKLGESFHKSFGLPVTVIRPFNTYGPRQSARAVIPTILMQAISGRPDIRLGDTTTTRDFNFVEDTVAGMIKLAECDDAAGATVNIGTGIEISVGQVVRDVETLLKTRLTVRADTGRLRPADSEVQRLCADNSLLKSLTGWSPGTTLNEGLRITADWMQKRISSYQTEKYYV